MEWSLRYPGIPSMVPAIRAFVIGLLEDSPRRHDAGIIASELATNSLRHTPSGRPGGEIQVEVSGGDGWARIAVTDQGAGGWDGTLGQTGEDEETGRGLEIVAALASKMGHDVSERGQTVWAELMWPALTAAAGFRGGSPAAAYDAPDGPGSPPCPGPSGPDGPDAA